MTGQAVAQVHETTPGVSAAAGRKGFKAELDDLRERMRRLGLGYDEIAAEIGRRYRTRPRESYRLAWGWSLNHAAARFNALSAQQGTDPQARAGMTGPHLCEHERWPDGGRKPSVFALLMLAQLYETDVLLLLDLADHESLVPQDRLTLIRHLPQSGNPARQTLRVHDVARDMVAVAETSAREDKRAAPCRQVPDAADQSPSEARGLSLSLPYVPGRLVIEISDPAVNDGPIATAGCAEPPGVHLVLVQDLPG